MEKNKVLGKLLKLTNEVTVIIKNNGVPFGDGSYRGRDEYDDEKPYIMEKGETAEITYGEAERLCEDYPDSFEILGEVANKNDNIDFTKINGIGKKTSKQIIKSGLDSFDEIVKYSVKQIIEKTGIREDQANDLLDFAKENINDEK
jgi:predicted flap endonuclease-1-like 5' DNA nuclease